MRCLLAMTFLSGCGASSALEIVVEMPPGDAPITVDRVQLYLGLGDPQNESGRPERLVPRDYRYPDVPDGFYWKRDPNGAQDVLDVDPGAADVRFTFQEGSDDKLTAIVVGYSADKIVAATSLVDAYLEAGSVRQYHVVLKPASAAFPRPTVSPVTVHRWGPGPTDTRCAYLEDPQNQDTPSIFVVDHADRDCDGFADSDDPADAPECLPDVYQGTVRPKRVDTRCLRSDIIPNAANDMACVLGGPGCVDGKGETACVASTTCAAPGVCSACAQRADALDCMATLPLSSTTATRIDCTVFSSLAGGMFCPGAAVLTERFQFLPMCNVDAPYLLWQTSQDKWAAQTLTKDGVTFTAAKPTAACDFSLTVTGTPSAAATSFRSVVSFQIANGRSAALPLGIKVLDTPDCIGVVNECHVAGESTVASELVQCMSSRVVQPW